MIPTEKLQKIFAPLDYVVITKKYEYMCPANEDPDLPEIFFNDAKAILGTGDYPSRNPTCWHIFGGREIEVNSEEWKKGVLNFYRLTSEVEVSELDNDRDFVSLEAIFEVLVVNARQFTPNLIEEFKCIIVKTAFGDFSLNDQVFVDNGECQSKK